MKNCQNCMYNFMFPSTQAYIIYGLWKYWNVCILHYVIVWIVQVTQIIINNSSHHNDKTAGILQHNWFEFSIVSNGHRVERLEKRNCESWPYRPILCSLCSPWGRPTLGPSPWPSEGHWSYGWSGQQRMQSAEEMKTVRKKAQTFYVTQHSVRHLGVSELFWIV